MKKNFLTFGAKESINASRAGRKRKQASAGVTFTPAERRAAVRGALLAHLPAIAGMALLGVLLYLLARLWLMPG